MEARYHLQNSTHMVEFPLTGNGWKMAIAFRKYHAEFKGKRIKNVIQAFPSKVPVNMIMKRGMQ